MIACTSSFSLVFIFCENHEAFYRRSISPFFHRALKLIWGIERFFKGWPELELFYFYDPFTEHINTQINFHPPPGFKPGSLGTISRWLIHSTVQQPSGLIHHLKMMVRLVLERSQVRIQARQGWRTKLKSYCLLQYMIINWHSWMVTHKGIQTYVYLEIGI